MDDDFNFKKLEDTKEEEKKVKEEVPQEAFITGLPDWDLEPLYETLNRGSNQ